MKKSTLISLLAIVLAVISAAIYVGNNEEKRSKIENGLAISKIDEKNIDRNKTVESVKSLSKETSRPIVVVVMPTPTSQPTMTDKPRVIIDGPESATKGNEFILKLKILPMESNKIIGAGTDVRFDKKILKVTSVELINADRDSSDSGTIWSNAITGINVLNDNGINGNYAIINFVAKETGETKITANVKAVDENMITADIVAVKTIKTT